MVNDQVSEAGLDGMNAAVVACILLYVQLLLAASITPLALTMRMSFPGCRLAKSSFCKRALILMQCYKVNFWLTFASMFIRT